MNNTFNLAKIYFAQTFNQMMGKTNNSKNKSKTSGIMLIVFISLVLLSSTTYLMINYANQLAVVGQQQFVLVLGLIYASLINLFLVVYEVQGYFYKTKDYEMLASMPIKPISIVTAKYISSYLTSIIYSSLMAAPAFGVYFYFCKVSAPIVIYALIALLLLPTFIIFLGSIIGFLINIITSKLKNKNVVTTLFTLIFVIAIVALTSLSNTGMLTNMFATGKMPLAIKIIFPYIMFLFNAITTGSFVQFLLFLILTLSYAILGILVVSASYKKINSNFLISSVKVSKKPLTFKQGSTTTALLKKEAKSFFGSAIWCTNTLIGPIMMIFMAVVFGSMCYSITSNPTNSFDGEVFKAIYLCTITLFSGMCVTTCVTISLEGKKVSLLKSFPVSFKQIAFAKILFNIILQLPFLLIANIVFLSLVPFNIWFTLLSFIVPIMSVLAFSALGLIINLKWPKTNWSSETEAVKQSMSLFVSMFGDMFLAAVPMIVYLISMEKIAALINPNIFYAIMFVWFLIIFAVAWLLIKKHGKKLYDELN